jgi:hypothetical protein
MSIAARGGCQPVVQVPEPRRVVAGYRAAANLVHDDAVGTTEFAE